MSADEDYVYDEDSGEWMPASELAAKQAAANRVEVRDAVGNVLSDGDQVTLIKDLDVKGAGQTLKQGTLIKSIRLTGDPQEIDCKYPGTSPRLPAWSRHICCAAGRRRTLRPSRRPPSMRRREPGPTPSVKSSR